MANTGKNYSRISKTPTLVLMALIFSFCPSARGQKAETYQVIRYVFYENSIKENLNIAFNIKEQDGYFLDSVEVYLFFTEARKGRELTIGQKDILILHGQGTNTGGQTTVNHAALYGHPYLKEFYKSRLDTAVARISKEYILLKNSTVKHSLQVLQDTLKNPNRFFVEIPAPNISSHYIKLDNTPLRTHIDIGLPEIAVPYFQKLFYQQTDSLRDRTNKFRMDKASDSLNSSLFGTNDTRLLGVPDTLKLPSNSTFITKDKTKVGFPVYVENKYSLKPIRLYTSQGDSIGIVFGHPSLAVDSVIVPSPTVQPARDEPSGKLRRSLFSIATLMLTMMLAF